MIQTNDGGATDLTYSFEKTEPHPGQPRYTWAVVGPEGAVHIWAQQNAEEASILDVYLAALGMA